MTRFRNSVALILAACAWPAAHAAADVITYTVDPTQSSLTISGTYEGDSFLPEPHVATSLLAAYSGTILADRDFLTNTVQITGGTITAQNSAVLGAANYAFIRPAETDTDILFSGDILNLVFSPSSPLIDSPSTFDMSQLAVSVTSGEIDYAMIDSGNLGGGMGGHESQSLSMTGVLTLVSGSGSIANPGGAETLTLPVEADYEISIPNAGGAIPLDVHFSGDIVATISAPEPTSFATICTLTIAMLFRRRARASRQNFRGR